MRKLLCGSFLLLTLACTSASPATSSDRSRYGSWSPDGSRIVFEREVDGDFEVFTMSSDGTDLLRLTHSPGGDGLPRYSPDGRHISFNSARDGERRIFVMDVNGKGVRALPRGAGFADGSAWSPDSKYVVFDSGIRGSGVRELYRVRADGSELQRLVQGDHAVYSPDGSQLAYCDGEPGGYLGIYRLDLETLATERISRKSDPDFLLDWSPSGDLLAVCSSRDHGGEAMDIYLMKPDGTDQRRITMGEKDDCPPSFSPDGKKILFTSWRTGREELFLMDLDGSNQMQLTNQPPRGLP